MSVWSSGSSGLSWPVAPHPASRRSRSFLSRFGGRAARARPWGEDLVEQSLSALLYPSRWDDVGLDELVLLLPSLHHGMRAAPQSGAAAVFGAALAEWTHRSAQLPDPAAARDVLAILDTLHQLALGHPSDRILTTADAMRGAIYARVNAAYADARLDHLHEPLMVAAWIGHLVAGRDALLPTFIAVPLAALIAAGLSPSSRRQDVAAAIVVRYAAAGGGTRHLARIAAKVCRSGRPRLVRSTVGLDPFTLLRSSEWTFRTRHPLPAPASKSGD